MVVDYLMLAPTTGDKYEQTASNKSATIESAAILFDCFAH